MAEAGDIIQEFKHAKPAEKGLIVAAIIGIVGIAWYLHAKSAGSASPAQGSTTGTSGGTTSQSGLQTFPYGSTPVLDNSGNPVAVVGPPPTTPTGSSSQPANWYTNFLGKVGYNSQIRPGGTDANGQRFYIGSGNSNMFYAPVGSTFQHGPAGRLWITSPGNGQQLLTGPGQVAASAGPKNMGLVNKQQTFVAGTAAGVKH